MDCEKFGHARNHAREHSVEPFEPFESKNHLRTPAGAAISGIVVDFSPIFPAMARPAPFFCRFFTFIPPLPCAARLYGRNFDFIPAAGRMPPNCFQPRIEFQPGNEKSPRLARRKSEGFLLPLLGNVLLSRDPSVQVPSALEGLTVVFGMGTRGSPPLLSPNSAASRSVSYFTRARSLAQLPAQGPSLLQNRMRNMSVWLSG